MKGIINILLLLVIIASSQLLGRGKGLEKVKEIADSLFAAEKYFDAVTEYKRFDCFSGLSVEKYQVNFRIALCYKKGGKYDDAVKYFKNALLTSSNINDSLETELQIVRVNILRRTIPEALTMLDNIEKKYIKVLDSDVINYWRGWAYMIGEHWEIAASVFEKDSLNKVLQKLSLAVYQKHYSVGFAKTISFIVPGAGQFYTGEYLSGIMSLGWNVLWGYLTINAFITDRAVEGILIGGLLWTRFYRGNFINAEKFAIRKNTEISNKAYEYLAKEYKGIRP